MNALAHSYLFWMALIVGLLALYILPSVIAAVRGVQGLGWIIVINLLPSGVGWIAALIAAVGLPGRPPTHAATQSLRAAARPPTSHLLHGRTHISQQRSTHQ
jgi:Superinfection immunity protein